MLQQATLPSAGQSNARNYKDEKVLVHQRTLVALVKDALGSCTLEELAELCVWTGRSPHASRHYASLWVYTKVWHISGSGMAGGWGYCRASSASAEAFSSAGIELKSSIAGCGMTAVDDALVAIGAAAGYCRNNLYVIRGA